MNKTASQVLKGAGAGAIATVCMSSLMLFAKRTGISGEMPPRRITKEIVKQVTGVRSKERTLSLLTTAAHLGFGMVGGALFGSYRSEKRPRLWQGMAYGMAYGTGIWLLSYRGFVPRLGLMPHAKHDRPGRVWSNVAAHLVYGAALVGCLDWLWLKKTEKSNA